MTHSDDSFLDEQMDQNQKPIRCPYHEEIKCNVCSRMECFRAGFAISKHLNILGFDLQSQRERKEKQKRIKFHNNQHYTRLWMNSQNFRYRSKLRKKKIANFSRKNFVSNFFFEIILFMF